MNDDNFKPPTGSAYVPIESYVYPLFDRLAALGIIDTAFVGIRPWTRVQCARLVEEAQDRIEDNQPAEDTLQAVQQLAREFAPELTAQPGGLALDSLYAQSYSIGGRTIPDHHFGQTLIDNYGRPYGTGANGTLGFAATEVAGPFVFHVRGEYEHAAKPESLTPAVQQFLDTLDVIPQTPLAQTSTVNRFRLIEAYGGIRLKNTNITIGKQYLWWGPSPDSATLFTNNSEPIYMIRLQQDVPVKLPWIFKYLGPMRWDAFFGHLDGHRHPASPYLHGQKLTFKPTHNLELGFSRTVEFAGDGHPLTFFSFWRSFISVGDSTAATPGSSHDVGDRRGGFDFSYRLPKLRNLVTLYGDFFTDDDPSPLSAPTRSGLIPGIYVTRLPFVSRADLRVEALVTDQASVEQKHGRFFYYNEGYKDGYTNNGDLIGSWIGRDSKAILATSRYWFSPLTNLAVTYRNVKLSAGYIPGGGTQHDVTIDLHAPVGKEFLTSVFVQYEQWNIPLLDAWVRRNVTIGVEFSFRGLAQKRFSLR